AVISSHVGATHQRTSDRDALPEVPPFPAQCSAVPGPVVGAGLPGLVAACCSGAAGTRRTVAEGFPRSPHRSATLARRFGDRCGLFGLTRTSAGRGQCAIP